MANPNQTAPAAPPPPDAKKDEKKKLTEAEELAAAKAELAKLEAANELQLTQQKIDSIKNGGKTPGQLKRIRAAEEKREATHKFEVVGADKEKKVFCKYQLTELSYKQGRLMKAGEFYDLPYETLPGDSMVAVKPVDKKAKPDFEAAS